MDVRVGAGGRAHTAQITVLVCSRVVPSSRGYVYYGRAEGILCCSGKTSTLKEGSGLYEQIGTVTD